MPFGVELEVEPRDGALKDLSLGEARGVIDDDPFLFAELCADLAVALEIPQLIQPLGRQQVESKKELLHIEREVPKVEVRGLQRGREPLEVGRLAIRPNHHEAILHPPVALLVDHRVLRPDLAPPAHPGGECITGEDLEPVVYRLGIEGEGRVAPVHHDCADHPEVLRLLIHTGDLLQLEADVHGDRLPQQLPTGGLAFTAQHLRRVEADQEPEVACGCVTARILAGDQEPVAAGLLRQLILERRSGLGRRKVAVG